ncbi:MAG: phosphoribosylamine--glycine ligase [Campylobacteraceae bacterium]|jgi:phosphoribosylamine--glycine ligase|nr:phosphoribosylamine--glycine ligase [Campylobacteraceae bacterium]
MNVLIVGNGAREYSIALALKKSSKLNKLFFAPGNGATSALGENISVADYEGLANFAKKNQIDLTIVGPEAPLSSGIVDVFKKHNLKIFGPSKKAARLESSKAFMKNILAKYNIPTAKYIETTSEAEAFAFIDALEGTVVVKADGLCAGKGVIICNTKDEAKDAVKDMLNGDSFGDAGKRVVVEEYLDGFELSVFALTDGKNYKILPAAQDHKRLKDGNEGPNTGGMGAYAPTPLCTPEIMAKIEKNIIAPTIKAMEAEGSPFEGVLFAGIMVVNNEPYTLEFNVRFGDPECEVLMPLISSDVLELFDACAGGEVESLKFSMSGRFAVGVVAASKDYPYSNAAPVKISIDEAALASLSTLGHISYAGVEKREDGLYANGGRILVAVGIADDIKTAQQNAYKIMSTVKFDGMQYRKDIAYQVVGA